MIDAVYFHFAGPDSRWNSTWWSESRQAEETFQYDGKRLFNMATLHQPSTVIDAARTIIHETGHVLGAPDLHSYSRYTSSASPLRSTCTWDLMDNNTGDINGFFKWMFGWIDDDDIVRVVANSRGIEVKKGDNVLQSIPSQADEQGHTSASTTLNLASFDSDVLNQCGGFVLVSNADEGRYANYYLIQYEQAAGNQSVQWIRGSDDASVDIPNGFRIFRVQGQLNESDYFIASNTSGTAHDMLIEALDMDETEEHSSSWPGVAPMHQSLCSLQISAR